MQHVEQTILLLSLFDGTKAPSHNDTVHRTMSGSQPSITRRGRAGPLTAFIFTQSLWRFGVSNTKTNLPQADADSCAGMTVFICKKLL